MNLRAYKHWTHQEVRLIETQYLRQSAAEIGAQIGRSKTAVRGKARALGLTVQFEWTDEQVAKLKAEYGHKSGKQLAREMGRSPNAIFQKWRRVR
jgi:hypothetical protein